MIQSADQESEANMSEASMGEASMSETHHRRNTERRSIELEALKNEPASLLSLGLEDAVLRKLETYRLYQAGYAAEDIAQAFGYARPHLYKLWKKLETGGIEALVDKRWGAAPRTRTTEREAQVLRAKALEPERGDADLAAEFKMDRSTVYELLKEHNMQDLHRVLASQEPMSSHANNTVAPTSQAEAEKGGAKSCRASRHCT
jgi:transposase